MRIKRTLAMVLGTVMTLSLCLTLLPGTAHAATADGDVFIGSVQVAGGSLSGKQYLLADGTPGNSGNYAIEYDPTVPPAKITVKDNASINAAYHDVGSDTSSCIYSKNVNLAIYIESGKTLTLSNLSTQTNPTGGSTAYDHGIHLAGSQRDLSVSGGGTLSVTVTGETAKNNCYGIYAGPLTVSGNTTVTAMGGASRNESYGVCAIGKITVDAGSSLTANAGSVSGTADDNLSGGVRCTSLEVGGTLEAHGGSAARSSYGVYSTNNMRVSGTLTATGGPGLTGGASYGVTVGSGSVEIFGRGSVTATANGTDTIESFGVQASGGISMSNNSHLIAQVEAAPDFLHSAKMLRDSAGQNYLSADLTAVWRESSSGAFAPISTYNDSGYAQDKRPRAYLEVKAGGDGLKADPTRVDFGAEVKGANPPAATSVDVINTSWSVVTLTPPSLTNYTVTLGQTTLQPNGYTAATIQPTSAAMNAVGDYGTTIVISGSTAGGDAVRVEIPVTFQVGEAPSFSQQPVDKRVDAGSTMDFFVTTAGTEPITYQWQYSSDNGRTWQNVTEGTGGTTRQYTTPAARAEMNGWQYRCLASNSIQSDVPSNAATLTVISAATPTVTATPASSFPEGNAPALRLTVGAGVAGFSMENLQSVTMTINGRATLLTRGTHYNPSNGSIRIDFVQSWLNTLQPATYPVDIELKGGTYAGLHVHTTITVTAQSDVPKTGDPATPFVWLGLALLAGAGLAVSAAVRRKRG